MRTIAEIPQLRAAIHQARNQGQKIALVPTMGNLHQGHLNLVQTARQNADLVVVSIFVNPIQFGANEDLDSYPRTLAEDQQKLQQYQTDLLFAPTEAEIYPNGRQRSIVHVPQITEELCGAHRPGHFDGVSTVVTKLFNIVQPDVAIFGEKDFQQLAVIRQMTRDLDMAVKILGVATCRETDGLAMSSRNNYLSKSERKTAPLLYNTLHKLKNTIAQGQRDYLNSCEKYAKTLTNHGFQVDYLEIRDAETLRSPSDDCNTLVILGAAKLGSTRLIDNVTMVLKAFSD